MINLRYGYPIKDIKFVYKGEEKYRLESLEGI